MLLISTVTTQPPAQSTSDSGIPGGSSSWAIAAAIIVAAMPHLWQFLSGQQKAKADLTSSLLESLKQSYTEHKTTTEELKDLLQSVAVKPIEQAQSNSQNLRDLLGETAELRERMLKLEKHLEFVSTNLTRALQTTNNKQEQQI